MPSQWIRKLKLEGEYNLLLGNGDIVYRGDWYFEVWNGNEYHRYRTYGDIPANEKRFKHDGFKP